jgi:hypothetical protein
MELDITSLGNAVQRLREGLARYEREPADEQIRDGLIQRFEFTASLTEAFSESDLPYKVDIVDWHNIDDRWRRTIAADRVTLTWRHAPTPQAARLEKP